MLKLPSMQDIDSLLDAGDLAAARELVKTLHNAAQSLREDNLDLREQLAATGSAVTFTEGLYWRTGAGDQRDGPFCQQCQDANDKLSRLQASVAIGGMHQWWCSVCGSQYDRP